MLLGRKQDFLDIGAAHLSLVFCKDIIDTCSICIARSFEWYTRPALVYATASRVAGTGFFRSVLLLINSQRRKTTTTSKAVPPVIHRPGGMLLKKEALADSRPQLSRRNNRNTLNSFIRSRDSHRSTSTKIPPEILRRVVLHPRQ